MGHSQVVGSGYARGVSAALGSAVIRRVESMRSGWKSSLLLAAVVLFPAIAQAQTIAGVVRDASGAVLPGVTVEASSPALIEKVRTAVTEGSGQYRLDSLVAGTYSVTYTLPGFSTVKREGVEVQTGVTVTLNADLRVGGIQ